MADVITLNEIDEIKNLLNTNGVNTNINVNEILERLGSASDTNGTTEDGTVMAKLNSLLTVNSNHGLQTYSTAGAYTWTCPEGVHQIYVSASGGAGGGGGGGGGGPCPNSGLNGHGASGGGSGGAPNVISAIVNVSPGNSYAITIGAGGSGGAGGNIGSYSNSYGFSGYDGSAGGAGGVTKFGNFITCNGGTGGFGGNHGDAAGLATTAPEGVSGGSAGYLSAGSEIIIIFASGGRNGISGSMGSTVYYADKYYNESSATGGAGGASVSNTMSVSSGAGGKGGNVNTNRATTYTAGTSGSKGTAGKMTIIW